MKNSAPMNEFNTPISGVALSSKTQGEICLVFSPSILFKVAKIAYEVFIDGSFQYSIEPYYDVINGLPVSIFQGIPGIDLDKRLPIYYRVNMTPVYVTERSPEPNRVGLGDLLKEVGMDHLNRLEWMIRTKRTYMGDNFVTKPFGFDNDTGFDNANLYAREASILRMLGMRKAIVIDGVAFKDADRPALLKSHILDYERMEKARRSAIAKGQAKAKAEKRYKGRKRACLPEPLLEETLHGVAAGLLSKEEAAKKLGVSRMTLYRRLKELKVKGCSPKESSPSFPFPIEDLTRLARFYGLKGQVGEMINSSRDEQDIRYGFPIGNSGFLKLYSVPLTEERLSALQRLVDRYRSLGLFAPNFLKNKQGFYGCLYKNGEHTFYGHMEEKAPYPSADRKMVSSLSFRHEVLAFLGQLAARYSGVDLMKENSMWSLLDLSPLDQGQDEKSENLVSLLKALKNTGEEELANQVQDFDAENRKQLRQRFRFLPRCVYQGDLNPSNLLVNSDHHFCGLLDFNLAGTEVNINCFLSETCPGWDLKDWEKEEPAIFLERDWKQWKEGMGIILEKYLLSPLEKETMPFYQNLILLEQYPNVMSLLFALSKENLRPKAIALIRLLIAS
jgi:predicted DNA-binding transcriptional regulator AlpA